MDCFQLLEQVVLIRPVVSTHVTGGEGRGASRAMIGESGQRLGIQSNDWGFMLPPSWCPEGIDWGSDPFEKRARRGGGKGMGRDRCTRRETRRLTGRGRARDMGHRRMK